MLLKYYQSHKSIENAFKDITLPDFVVLTGKNGSGKTHLLTGIKEGKFLVEGLETREILYLSYLDFSQNFQTKTNRLELFNAWTRFNDNNDIICQLKIKGDVMSEYTDIIEQSAINSNKPIFSLSIKDLQTADGEIKTHIFKLIQSAKKDVESAVYNQDSNGDLILQFVVDSVLKQTKILPSKLKEADFNSLFQKTVFGKSKILSDLSQVFFEYYKNIERNERKRRKGLGYLDEEKFIQKFGRAPWILIRNIFIGFGLPFDINDPDQEDIDPMDGSFEIKFKNLDREGKIVSFIDLSSGEQILITLINAIYTAGNRHDLPKLVLLDEVDSPLNPSIIDKFILYILENFIANGINVVIATHSPSTVAFAPEDAIYLVNTKEVEPLTAVNSNEAVNKLSEGFITLSDVINFKKIPQSKIIISEGKNYTFLSRGKDVFAPQDEDLIVLSLNIGGTAQLRTLFEFMRNFNRSKTFIFVFDCDYRYKEIREENGGLVKDEEGVQKYDARNLDNLKTLCDSNNKIFIFEENKNSKSSRGIENLFTIESTIDYQGEFDKKSPKNKKGLEKYILNRNEKLDFINFQSLFEFISNKESYNNF